MQPSRAADLPAGGAGSVMMPTPLRYVLLQLPGWLLAGIVLLLLWEWDVVRVRTALLLLALYLAKDVVLYPFVRHAYATSAADGSERLVGATGTVRRRLDPRGYVLVNGELWRAEGPVPLDAGARVRVVGVRGLTVLVEPDVPAGGPGGGAGAAAGPAPQSRSPRKNARMSATSASGSSSAAK